MVYVKKTCDCTLNQFLLIDVCDLIKSMFNSIDKYYGKSVPTKTRFKICTKVSISSRVNNLLSYSQEQNQLKFILGAINTPELFIISGSPRKSKLKFALVNIRPNIAKHQSQLHLSCIYSRVSKLFWKNDSINSYFNCNLARYS